MRNQLRVSTTRLICVAGFACSMAFNSVEAQNAQNQLEPVDAFVTAANALAKSTTERVDLGRALMRKGQLVTELTGKMLALQADDKKIKVAFDTRKLLCDVRAANVEVAARRNYIQAVAGKVEAVGKPTKIDNLETAFKVLFAGQSLDITAGIPTSRELNQERNNIQARCQKDLTGFTRAYYGEDIVPPAQAELKSVPAGFGPIGALIDAIISVIAPVVEEGARMVDENRRRNVVLAYLRDPNNIEKIQESGMALATAVSDFTLDKRLRLAGAFYEQSAVLRATEIDLSKNDNCKNYLSSRKPTSADGKTLTDDFVLCWRAAWTQIEAPVASLLKAAEQYDQLADAGDTNNAKKAFEPLAKALTNISRPNQQSLADFWRWAIRLVAFAEKVETAFSKESRTKIDKAIDDLAK